MGQARCWHCGSQLDPANAEFIKLPPDEVRLINTPVEKLVPGDLVVLRRSIEEQPQGLHVKRILAVPGQTVTVDEQSRLLVDDQIPRFETNAKLLVDSGRYRVDSRWQMIGDRWWRYDHRLVHRGNRPGPILDDYPGNIAIDRMLHPVSTISVRSQLETDAVSNRSSVIEEVRLWDQRGPQSLGLSSESPVAVRVRNGLAPDAISSAIRSLNIYREIVYRATEPQSLHESYPVALGNDEFFVVGDNVPLSVDSRTWGPIRRKELVGRVILKSGASLAGSNHRH